MCRTWKILQKIIFLRKNLGELLDARVPHIFEISANSASFDTLHAQFRRNFFSTLIRDGAVFLEVKNKSHEAKRSRKITGPYCTAYKEVKEK
jgi:hypothetical protein